MNYAPNGLYVWDAWCMPKDDEVHVYHLQRNRPGAEVEDGLQERLGHAVSRDLVHWEERTPAFGPDPDNPHDDRQPWTGCALWHEGQGHLFYTMRGSENAARLQKIGLATTTDPDRWTRHSANPVIVPDPRWYATEERPVPRIVDCRDLVVIPDPKGGWLGYYATRQPAEELPETAVIACVHSDDLVHWEHRPPAFAPGKYACIEVPEVFRMNGLWYMTCLTGHWYGNRGFWDDPNLVAGTIFAVAEQPEGPYREPKDNALLAARTTAPLSCRSVLFEGEQYVLYTDRERIGRTDAGNMTWGTLSTPKVWRTDGDRLYAAYSPRIETAVQQQLIGPNRPPVELTDRLWGKIWQMPSVRWTRGDTISGESRTGWEVMRFDAAADSFIFEATVTIEWGVAAGLALRLDEEMMGAVVALEAEQQAVAFYAAPAFDFAEKRQTPIARGTPIHLRVVNRLEHIEIYVNNELRLAFSRYRGIGGHVGLFVDRAQAHFDDLRLDALEVSPPSV
mgnify:CR=1 FL=1